MWKKYKIPHEKKDTLLEQLAGAFQVFEGERFTYEEFWALKGVNFVLGRGESMGIIGENGSGKSTLLKIIAKIIRPTKGSIEVNGKVAPILELGVGFQPQLSVRDNTLLYASILGLTNSIAKSRIDSILRFSDLERFRDAKLKNLSSGMQMRLAFAIAIETNPDIFLVDEGLAVGDLDFQRKCLDKFKEFQQDNKSIILVSHSLGLVSDFCPKAILLSHGEVLGTGDTSEIIRKYTDMHTSVGVAN